MNVIKRLQYVDMYAGFNYETSTEHTVFCQVFPGVEVVTENPDIIISGCYGHTHLQYDCFKIFITVENNVADNMFADLVIGSNYITSDMEFQYSNMISYKGFDDVLSGKFNDLITQYRNTEKQKFCVFMYGNAKAKARNIFCKQLMDYKHVDCLGSVMRNTELVLPKEIKDLGSWQAEQLYIYKDYKFTIAFENTTSKRYIGEKILQPLLVGSIPIYWGANDAKEYFNPDCFINVNDFDSFEKCIEYVKKVDSTPELYEKYRNAPIILPDSKLHSMQLSELLVWLQSRMPIITDGTYKKTGKISGFRKILYFIRFKWRMFVRREKQRHLYNVKK